MENVYTDGYFQKPNRDATNAKEIGGLRKLSTEQANRKQPLHLQITSQFTSFITGLILPKQPLNTSMCKYYGHIVDMKNWGKGSPNCLDCGFVIKTKDDLRGSIVKTANSSR